MRRAFPSMLLIHPVLTNDKRDSGEHEIRQTKFFSKLQSPFHKRLSWELIDQAYRSTEQHSAPILAIAKKFGATGLTPGHHLFAYMHSAQGRLSSPAPETHACAQYKVRVRPDAPWGRGAEALLSERLSSLC